MIEKFLRSLLGDKSGTFQQGADPSDASRVSQRRLDTIKRGGASEAIQSARSAFSRTISDTTSRAERPSQRTAGVPVFNPDEVARRARPEALVKKHSSTVLRLEHKSVRQFLLQCVKDTNEVWDAERRQQKSDAMDAAIMAHDPLDVALDLYWRVPARRSLPYSDDELRRLNYNFDEIHKRAWRLAGDEVEFSEAQLT